MQTRRASIKETGEELSQAEWERFDAAVAMAKAERQKAKLHSAEPRDCEDLAPTHETDRPGR